ncbi:MAG: tyrosine-type recombinase/integrase [Gammaproteobacteria bacterium]
MSPRPRNPLNSRLPPNLSLHGSGQFRYIHPLTHKDYYLGADRQAAIAAAININSKLAPANSLVEKVLKLKHSVNDCIDLFRKEGMVDRHWKPATQKLYHYRLNRIHSDLGEHAVESLTVKDCAEYLREVTESLRAREQYRGALILVLECAVQEGWISHNVAKATRVAKSERQRARLSLEAYRVIHQKAPAWLQNAMDLSVQTLLRRADICAMRFEDIRDGYLYVVPRKTETTSYVRMKMRLENELKAVIERCRDRLASPYLVHRLPIKLPAHGKRAKTREHHLQVLPEDISRTFGRVVKATGLKFAATLPPTFHEIRSLGGDLYRQAGWPLEDVQRLMGHASAEMTRHYLEGHDAPWVEVRAGLKINEEPVGKR